MCLQDPHERPSAIDLLMHPFIASAEQPPDFAQRVVQFLDVRPPLDQRGPKEGGGGTGSGNGSNMATMPRWV